METSTPFRSAGRRERFPKRVGATRGGFGATRGGLDAEEGPLARTRARRDAARDEPCVARDLAQAVEDAEICTRGGWTAGTLDQAVLVRAGVVGSQVLEAHALELDVAGQ